MNRILFLLAILLCSTSAVSAQNKTGEQRRQWMEEMRQLRVKFVVNELKLTDEQRAKFEPAYQSMIVETDHLMRDTRKLYESVKRKGASATDLEKEKAAETMFESKGRENEIEMRYFAKFKEILTPDQLFQLREAEHKFSRQLMKQRRQKNK